MAKLSLDQKRQLLVRVMTSKTKVLLICPRFFGYEERICSKLLELEYDVDLIIDTPSDKGVIKGLIRLFRPLFRGYITRSLSEKIKEVENQNYSKIIIVKGEYVTEEILRYIKCRFSGAELIYYNWDSIKNSPYSLSLIEQVSRAYTFDSFDSECHKKLQLLPLFYVDEYRQEVIVDDLKYDVCFVGTARKGRFSCIEKISSLQEELSLCFYVYVQSRIKHYINILMIEKYSKFDKRYINFSPITAVKIKEIFDSSKAVLDIQHPSQSGLTMRTFECLASGKKLITTNENIKYYDFYNEENIFILRNGNIGELQSFIRKPYVELNKDLVKKYSLESWSKTIMGCDNEW